MDHVINALCYIGTILQRNYRKMTIKMVISYSSFVKLHEKKSGSHNMTMLYLICVITRCVVKGLHCMYQMGLDARKPVFRALLTTKVHQPAHLRSLISTFVFRFFESIIYKLATSEFSTF